MKQNKKELDIDLMGSEKELTKAQEQEISAFIKSFKTGSSRKSIPKPAKHNTDLTDRSAVALR